MTKTRAGRPTSACSNDDCLLEIEPGKLEVLTRDPNIKYCFACHKQPEKSSNFILHSLFGSAGSGQQEAAQAINVAFDQPFDEEDHSENSVQESDSESECPCGENDCGCAEALDALGGWGAFLDEQDHSENSVEEIRDSDEKELSQEFDKDFEED